MTSVPVSPASASHLLTFDLEHWYEGYRLRGFGGWENLPARDPATLDRLLNLLAEFNQRATFFVTGRFATEFPAAVKSGVLRRLLQTHRFTSIRDWLAGVAAGAGRP